MTVTCQQSMMMGEDLYPVWLEGICWCGLCRSDTYTQIFFICPTGSVFWLKKKPVVQIYRVLRMDREVGSFSFSLYGGRLEYVLWKCGVHSLHQTSVADVSTPYNTVYACTHSVGRGQRWCLVSMHFMSSELDSGFHPIARVCRPRSVARCRRTFGRLKNESLLAAYFQTTTKMLFWC